MTARTDLKDQVRDFWDEQSCGEVYASGEERDFYLSHDRARYALEPYIRDFAGFTDGAGKDVLEIGVGLGADHMQWAMAQPRSLAGIDLTPRAVEHTKRRMELFGHRSDVRVGDAEALPFEDSSFDLVYSYGVLHHSPDTPRAVREVHRVLRHGGTARIMVYHTYALTGYMLWLRYGLLRLRPFTGLRAIYAAHLESPGTKAYTRREAREMFSAFSHVDVSVRLSFGDLLEGAVGQRHGGALLSLAKRFWPRALIRRTLARHGLLLMVTATK